MVSRYPEVKIQLDDSDLENKGGQVAYQVKGTIPAKYMKKKATMSIVPTVEYNGQTIALKPIEIQGEKAKGTGTTISYKNGGVFTGSGSFEFKDGYEEANLVAVSTATKGKKSHTFDPVPLCEGVKNTASRTRLMPELSDKAGNGTYLLYAAHGYKPEFVTSTAILYFDVNNATLNMNQKLNKGDEAKKAVAAFGQFMNEGRKIDKVIIAGWASPEGEESHNQGLSEKRAEQGKQWFEKEFDKYLRKYAKDNKIKYKDLQKPEIKYEVTAPGEDWSGFESIVEASSIQQKNEILTVVRAQKNPADREQKIREMTDIYNEIADKVLPPLRRVEVGMRCNKNDYTDQQIAEMIYTDPDALSLNEKLYAASMEQDLSKKAQIYADIINKDGNDWRAYNNLAILQVKQEKDLQSAMKNLEKAAAISPSNGIILNNKAIVEMLNGDEEAAMQDFAASATASVEPVRQDYNLAINKIKAGDYDGAAKDMGNKNCDYQMALVQCLQKKYAEAQKTVECIPDKNADVYYLAAVIAANMKDENRFYSNLTEALKLNPELKAQAKKDAEFKKFRKQERFKELVK